MQREQNKTNTIDSKCIVTTTMGGTSIATIRGTAEMLHRKKINRSSGSISNREVYSPPSWSRKKERKRDGVVIFLSLYFIQGLYKFRRWSMTHSYTLHSSHFGALGYKSPQMTYWAVSYKYQSSTISFSPKLWVPSSSEHNTQMTSEEYNWL